MRLPNINDISLKIEWVLQNDISEISNSRSWAEDFDPSYVQNWGKVMGHSSMSKSSKVWE